MIPVPDSVLAALCAQFTTSPDRLTRLGGGREDSDGVVFAFPSAGTEHVLKIMPITSDNQDGLLSIQERLRFVHFLGQHGVNIVYPIPMSDGQLLAFAAENEQRFLAYQMARVAGSHPKPEEWNSDFFALWGASIAKLHHVTQQYPVWRGSETTNHLNRPLLGWQEEWQFFHDICADPEIQQKWVSIRERLDILPVTRDSFGFTHNDPHIENILYDGTQITLLDFDVANYHWFISDVAIALQSMLFDHSGGMERPVSDPEAIQSFLGAFWRGYACENTLDDFWRDQLNLFISYRRILLFCAMQGWLATVPDTRASWKDMILSEPAVV
jgi:Ser/Thr protein kinase RdoA (MazF antagonist)